MSTVITALLDFVAKLIEWFRSHIDAAAEAEIARHAAAVLRMTRIGEELLLKIEEMHDDALDDLLKELGRP